LVEKFEPLELLATVSANNCFTDPEEYKETTHQGKECYVEYAQSLVLSQKCKKELSHTDKEATDKFNSLLVEIFDDVLWYFGSEAAEGKRNEVEEELWFTSISKYLFVRSDSFPEHHVDMIRDIYRSHDSFLEKQYGFNSGVTIH